MVWNDPDLIPVLQEEGSYSEHFTQHNNEEESLKDSQTQVPNSDMQKASLQQSKIRKNWAKQGAYNFNDSQMSQNNQSDYNVAEQKLQVNVNKDYEELEAQRGRNESNISNQVSNISKLNLCPTGLFSEGEPGSAAIIKQDPELAQLKMCSPNQQELNFQSISDEKIREERNKQIDELYERKNSGNFGNAVKKMETSDIYPPQQRPGGYQPDFKGGALVDPREAHADPILDNTPNATPQNQGEIPGAVEFLQQRKAQQELNKSLLASKLDRIKGIFGGE
jgi:hypothetical protein